MSSGRKRTLRAVGLSAGLVVAVCCGLAAAAQKSPQTTSDQRSAEKNTLRVRTNLVIVRVIVRDAKGNPVSDLARSDFHVFDNKKEQPIAYFSAETPAAATPPVAEAPAGSLKNSVAEKSARPIPGPAPQRYTALFFDDYHMQLANLVQIREAAKRFVDKNLDRGVRVAMYSTSGKVHLDFTNDRAKLEQAAAQLQFDMRSEPSDECPPMTDLQAQEIHDRPEMLSAGDAATGDGVGGR